MINEIEWSGKNPNIKLSINKKKYNLYVSPKATLLDVLRDEIGLIGTKKGCNTGDCGSCTVLIDGVAMNSCLLLAIRLQNNEITTIEGLAINNELHPIQTAFVESGAIQCGYCTPGMVLSTKALLDVNITPSIEDIKDALAGNLCRCTGYKKIIEAVQNAAFCLVDQTKSQKEN